MTDYEPGYCNIGRRQRRRRYAYAATAFGATVAGVLGVVGELIPRPLVLAAFVTLALGFEMLIQARTSFCVRLALLGRYDFRGEGGAGEVDDASARHADQIYAVKITAASLGLAALSTGVLVFFLR